MSLTSSSVSAGTMKLRPSVESSLRSRAARSAFAHRRAGHAELLGELHFLQRLPGDDLTVAQMRAQRVIDLLAEGEGAFDGFERRDHW